MLRSAFSLVPAWLLVAALFLAHWLLRMGGLNQPMLIPLSLLLLWPLPWIFLSRDGRDTIGLRRATGLREYGWALLIAALALLISLLPPWLAFGGGADNWLVAHAAMLDMATSGMPANWSGIQIFAALTVPALIFSPIGEELFFRGLLQTAVGNRLGLQTGLLVQAVAFALAHLAHYGLQPWQPSLLVFWLPGMFATAWLFGWLRLKSGSLFPVMLAHAAFNLGMNALAVPLMTAL